MLLQQVSIFFNMKIKLYFITVTIIITTIVSCNNKSLTYKIPDFYDQYYFDNIRIEKSSSTNNMYRNYINDFDECIMNKSYKDHLNLDSFLEENKTLSFIILKNDSILYEKYFYDTLSHPTTPTFSISKSFVSSLLGIAIENGNIKSIDEPITNYIPELQEFGNITLEMLLNMCSGLNCNGIMKNASIYFSTDLKETIKDYYIEKKPGTEYSYENINTLLLCIAIERATNINIATYLENELWKKAGMSHDATWSVDCKENQQVKGFCGINAAPIDLARFGSIYLHNGFYNGEQIVPMKWVKESFTKHNKLKDEDGYYYSYSWRITENNAYVAVGFMGQYIYVAPAKNLVVVRTGESYDSFNWIEFIEEMTSFL